MTGPRICITQPEHLPWLGFFDKLARVDVCVLLDTVQFKKRYVENRNRIRTADGWQWVAVPVRSKGRYHQVIRDVEIEPEPRWAERYWRAVDTAYAPAPHFARYRDFVRDTLTARTWTHLAPLNQHLITWGAHQLGLSPEVVTASSLSVEGRSTELLVAICRALGARVYLSGISGKAYLDESRFRDEGIAVEYQTFHHPAYRQAYEPFVPCMGFLDLLCNAGPDARQVLCGEHAPRLETVFL